MMSLDDEFAEDVRNNGWALANVSDHKPPFQYTIGLMETLQHPEFILFGLEGGQGHALFSVLIGDIQAGKSFRVRGAYAVNIGGKDFQVGFRRVHPTQHPPYLGFAMGFLTNIGHVGELQAMQAFWSDRAGKFPFDAGCELGVCEAQPRLDLGLTPREVRRFQRQFE
jgi:hypothetical protein